MLKELYIKNIAVIEEVRINFEDGFNVLTGETGAGKSILIDSINMAIGARTSKDLVRTGCDKAVVSACFSAGEKINAFLEENGIETDEESVILSRQLTKDAKSTSRINGMTVTGSILKEAGRLLIDIHGQNDNYFLLSNKYHISYLDDYAGLKKEKEAYLEKYQKLREVNKKIKYLLQNDEDKEKRAELLSFQINEIDSAKLKKGESEELSQRISYLANIEKIASAAAKAHEALYEGERSAYDFVKDAERALNAAGSYEKGLLDAAARLESAALEIEDISSYLSSYLQDAEFDEKEFDALNFRLDTINELKRKYKASEEEILKYRDKIAEELSELSLSGETLKKLQNEALLLEKETLNSAENLHQKREKAAERLAKEVMSELSDLDMPKVVFNVGITKKELSETGFDEAEFKLSANPGEEPRPLSKIASGGELSRIMLALKSIFSDTDTAETLIFDEIDTGVSGRAAQKIAEKLSRLSRKKQVFSITHLAQIASMADCHYLIKKTLNNDRTATNVTLLGEEGRTDELARIIGGAYITDLTLKNAEEMLTLAKEVKEKMNF